MSWRQTFLVFAAAGRQRVQKEADWPRAFPPSALYRANLTKFLGQKSPRRSGQSITPPSNLRATPLNFACPAQASSRTP